VVLNRPERDVFNHARRSQMREKTTRSRPRVSAGLAHHPAWTTNQAPTGQRRCAIRRRLRGRGLGTDGVFSMRLDAWGFPAIELAHTFFQVQIDRTPEAGKGVQALIGFAFSVIGIFTTGSVRAIASHRIRPYQPIPPHRTSRNRREKAKRKWILRPFFGYVNGKCT
jgi:hypothetical protein